MVGAGLIVGGSVTGARVVVVGASVGEPVGAVGLRVGDPVGLTVGVSVGRAVISDALHPMPP
jgi:hypothetical protein